MLRKLTFSSSQGCYLGLPLFSKDAFGHLRPSLTVAKVPWRSLVIWVGLPHWTPQTPVARHPTFILPSSQAWRALVEARGAGVAAILTSPLVTCGPAPSASQPSASQRSLHNAPIFRLLLKVAVNGTHQCDFLNF